MLAAYWQQANGRDGGHRPRLAPGTTRRNRRHPRHCAAAAPDRSAWRAWPIQANKESERCCALYSSSACLAVPRRRRREVQLARGSKATFQRSRGGPGIAEDFWQLARVRAPEQKGRHPPGEKEVGPTYL